MKIQILPDDIVKRCCWDAYVYYVIGSEKEAQRILKENNELELSERDALVIGLLKVIETDNLIHKFNTYIIEILTNKSIKDKELLIRKKTFDTSVDKFLDKFPDYWEPSKPWVKSIEELIIYIDDMKSQIEELEIFEIVDKNQTYEFYSSNSIRKLLKFNY